MIARGLATSEQWVIGIDKIMVYEMVVLSSGMSWSHTQFLFFSDCVAAFYLFVFGSTVDDNVE